LGLVGCGTVDWTYPNQFVVQTKVPEVRGEVFNVDARRFLAPSSTVAEWPDHLLGACLKAPGLDQSTKYPLEYAVVETRPGGIWFSGERVLELGSDSGWELPTSPENGLLISALYHELSATMRRFNEIRSLESMCWRSGYYDGMSQFGLDDEHALLLLLALDGETPASLLMSILYTADQSQYRDKFFLMSGDGEAVLLSPEAEAQLFGLFVELPTGVPWLPLLSEDAEFFGVKVDKKGFLIRGRDASGPMEQRIPCKDSLCEDDASYDYQALSDKLLIMRNAIPTTEDIVLSPDPELPYSRVLRTYESMMGSNGSIYERRIYSHIYIRPDLPPLPGPRAPLRPANDGATTSLLEAFGPEGSLSSQEPLFKKLPEPSLSFSGIKTNTTKGSVVLKLLERNRHRFLDCYSSSRSYPEMPSALMGGETKRSMSQKVEVLWSVDGSGRPYHFWFESAGVEERRLASCVAQTMKYIRFPHPPKAPEKMRASLSFLPPLPPPPEGEEEREDTP